MVRVTGDVVRQAQAAFLTSFRGHGGPLPGDLSRLFPEPSAPGSTPIALAQVIPGGFFAASQAIREQIDGARERLDVMNPYLTDPDIVERIIAAARRGVKVRIVVSEVSNNPQASAALRHRYADLFVAGAEVWELPGTVVHAKVVVADDVASFGTVNLDAWALYRNSELMMLTSSPRDRGAPERAPLRARHRPLQARGATLRYARAPREPAVRQAHVLHLKRLMPFGDPARGRRLSRSCRGCWGSLSPSAFSRCSASTWPAGSPTSGTR